MFRKAAIILTLVSAVIGAAPASANVSLKNGNFFIGYTDLIYPGGFDPKVERIYNSKGDFQSIFGFGWGNEYEAFLSVSADGSVIVHEYGGGTENRFNPIAFNEKELKAAVDTIAEAARSAGAVGNSEQLAKYKTHLATDAQFRNDEWEHYLSAGKLKKRDVPVGTQLHSNHFSYQFITKLKDGYQRNFDNGRIERFSEEGRLTRISDRNSNFIELSYNKEGKLAKLVDNFNRKMYFTFNSQGLLEKVQGENGKESSYKYSNTGELVYSKDVDGNVYTYKYDKRHNMTQIGYSDKSSMDMTYYGVDLHDNVKSVKERDGTLTEYKYEYDKGDKGHRVVAVNVKGSDGKAISSSKYEYYEKRKADGEEWTYKMVTTIDGDRTETTYNECCGLPLLIKRGNEETAFQYDVKGHVTKKITPTEVTDLAYDSQVGKVSKVTRYSKVNKKQNSWSTFSYDGSGNLVFAKNSEGKGVKLFYDSNGRIKSLVDQSHRQINFRYNESSKPVEITDPSLGSITVSYSNSGEIKKVESTAGRKIALQVTSAFQNLLDIIRPAGVNLSF